MDKVINIDRKKCLERIQNQVENNGNHKEKEKNYIVKGIQIAKKYLLEWGVISCKRYF